MTISVSLMKVLLPKISEQTPLNELPLFYIMFNSPYIKLLMCSKWKFSEIFFSLQHFYPQCLSAEMDNGKLSMKINTDQVCVCGGGAYMNFGLRIILPELAECMLAKELM